MKFNSPYISMTDKIELLEYYIIFNSYLYYILDTNIVEDSVFDNNAQQLIRLKNRNKRSFESSKYYKYFVNYDSSSGYDIIAKVKNEDDKLINRIRKDVKSLKII